jgi:two-component system chemotaxis response regulator CheB
VKHSGQNYRIRQEAGPPVNGFIASADKMFESMAREAGDACAGLVLSGMGNDGAAGLLKLNKAGGLTIGESEASCLVYGMPKAAAEMKALTHSMSLGNILEYINGKL